MTRRAACLCVLALLASASLFVAPALASEEDAASSEVAFAAAPSASVRSAAAISDAVAPEAAPEAAASASSDVAAVASAEAFAPAPAPATAEQFGEREFESLSLGVSAEERREESAARTNEKLTPLPYDFFSSSKTQTRRDHRPVRHGPGDLRRPRRRHPR